MKSVIATSILTIVGALISLVGQADEKSAKHYTDMTADEISVVIDEFIKEELRSGECGGRYIRQAEYLDEFVVWVDLYGRKCSEAMRKLNTRSSAIGITFIGKESLIRTTHKSKPHRIVDMLDSYDRRRSVQKGPNVDLIYRVDGQTPPNQSLQQTGDD